MIDYTISGSVQLPSKGKVYRDRNVDTTVTLKSMTTEHEMMRLSYSDVPYQNLCKIIDDCIIDPIGISAYDLVLGDYQAVLYKLRSVTYGPEYKLRSICPVCGSVVEGEISLDDLPIKEMPENLDEYLHITLPKSQASVTLNFQTPRRYDSIVKEVNNFKKKNPKAADPTLVYLLNYSIDSIDGQVLDFVEKDRWLRQLPAADSNYLISKISELNTLIGLDATLENTCDACGKDFETGLQITSEFFRPEI